ncbi:MAG: acyl-CoA thioesterase [Candidatus Carbobacillus altaicus]|nr:acyl-CoA thioesterase [Candidatus Carbobacillus altaicus]
MGVVYHPNYLSYFEMGRTTWIETHWQPYRAFEKRGLLLPLTDATVHYLKSAHYDETLEVQTTLTHLTPLRVTFDYRIVRSYDGLLLTTGKTQHVWVSPSFHPVSLKKIWPEAYAYLERIPRV